MASPLAAQYIRMSTDKQDLSPTLQKDAIAAYRAAIALAPDSEPAKESRAYLSSPYYRKPE